MVHREVMEIRVNGGMLTMQTMLYITATRQAATSLRFYYMFDILKRNYMKAELATLAHSECFTTLNITVAVDSREKKNS